jgi:inhibitor of KinA
MTFVTTFLTAGDHGLLVEFGNSIDEKINARVHLLAQLLHEKAWPAIRETVPTYRSLLLLFDPLLLSRKQLQTNIAALIAENKQLFAEAVMPGSAREVRIPVCYGGDFGPDLSTVAHHNNISADTVIQIHAAGRYKVYMLGFLPGFPYLGGLDERIACPRLSTPRTVVPAGSVGIAGNQTGVYPVDSPGGWQLIGKTPLALFDAQKENAFLLKPGDSIVFYPISQDEYHRL